MYVCMYVCMYTEKWGRGEESLQCCMYVKNRAFPVILLKYFNSNCVCFVSFHEKEIEKSTVFCNIKCFLSSWPSRFSVGCICNDFDYLEMLWMIGSECLKTYRIQDNCWQKLIKLSIIQYKNPKWIILLIFRLSLFSQWLRRGFKSQFNPAKGSK